MNIKGKLLGLALFAGLTAPMLTPTLAQAQPSGFFNASPQLINKVNKAYKTNFRAAPPVQAKRQPQSRREAMIWWFDWA